MIRSGIKINFIDASSYDVYGEKKPILEGMTLLETLCPVSKVTGHRTNPLDVLAMTLSPDKARLVDSLLQELPVSNEPSSNGNFEFLIDRLSTGSTPAEREQLARDLFSAADALAVMNPVFKKVAEQKIDGISFEKSDANVSDES